MVPSPNVGSAWFNLTWNASADYVRRLDVVNRGFSGYNTSQALAILPRIIEPYENGKSKILIMTIFLGANDAFLPSSSTKQHVPLNTFRSNLKAIITSPLLKSHQTRVILITLPPINEYGRARHGHAKGSTEVHFTAEHTKLYADACRELGQELKVSTLDLWTVFMKAAGWKEGEPLPGSRKVKENEKLKELLHDGLHFAAPAYKLLYGELQSLIELEMPELSPARMPFLLPTWQDAQKGLT
ncbi:MAG: hypothetical protein M1814_002448 [Vezdaea aestivalis]|nr:MAG: hypothetical protein M1814_002448 [Vezdaea aestivalis]